MIGIFLIMCCYGINTSLLKESFLREERLGILICNLLENERYTIEGQVKITLNDKELPICLVLSGVVSDSKKSIDLYLDEKNPAKLVGNFREGATDLVFTSLVGEPLEMKLPKGKGGKEPIVQMAWLEEFVKKPIQMKQMLPIVINYATPYEAKIYTDCYELCLDPQLLFDLLGGMDEKSINFVLKDIQDIQLNFFVDASNNIRKITMNVELEQSSLAMDLYLNEFSVLNSTSEK